MDDNRRYMWWLEKMWDVYKFDIHGRTEREEKRKEEVLGVFKGLGKLSECRVEPPDLPSWNAPPW